MSWYAIAQHHLKNPDACTSTRVYREADPMESGELVLWRDPDGLVAGFELSHAPFPRRHEYLLRWRRGEQPKVGEVDTSRSKFAMIPTARFARQPGRHAVTDLTGYFEQNATALEPTERDQVAGVLREAASLAVD